MSLASWRPTQASKSVPNLPFLTLAELRSGYSRKEFQPSEVIEAHLKRIEALNPELNAYLEVFGDGARDRARALDKKLAQGGPLGPLFGVPLAVKDVLCVEGTKTTCGSKMLEPFIAPYDASCIRRLRDQGAVFLGKTNMDEFAMGSSTENSAFGPTRNPFGLERVPGGSSGGSAAAVAAHLCQAALGSDTGGSIRQPAAFCGIVGLKPTYGRVSRYGLVAFASSLDQIGPMTKTSEDAAILFWAIAGHDPKDMTSSTRPVPPLEALFGQDPRRFRLGLPKEYFVEGMDQEVRDALLATLAKLEGLGIQVEEVSLPHTPYATAVYYIIATSEASSNLARYDGVKYGFSAKHADSMLELYEQTRAAGFGPEVKRRIMLGTYALSAGYYEAYFKKAAQVRRLILEDFTRAFEKVDAIVSPTTPTPPFLLGEKIEDPLTMYLSDIYTNALNLAGLPGMSLPIARTGDGLPVGMQIIAPAFMEERLFCLGRLIEELTNPPIQGVPFDQPIA